MKRDERARLKAVIGEVQSWVSQGRAASHMARHMPLTGLVGLRADDDAVLLDVARAAASGDLESAKTLLHVRLFDGRKKHQPAHEAAGRIEAFHHYMTTTGRHSDLGALAQRLVDQHEAERAGLSTTLVRLGALRSDAVEALELEPHLPLTRTGVLSANERDTMESLIRIHDLHAHAIDLLEDRACVSGDCEAQHASAALLHATLADLRSAGTPRTIQTAAKRLAKQHQSEGHQLERLLKKTQTWSDRMGGLRDTRSVADTALARRAWELRASVHTAQVDGAEVRLAGLPASDATLMSHLSLLHDTPLTYEDSQLLTQAVHTAEQQISVIREARAWDCARTRFCSPAHEAASALRDSAPGVEAQLHRLEGGGAPPRTLDQLLDQDLGFPDRLGLSLPQLAVLGARMTNRARGNLAAVVRAGAAAKAAAKAAKEAADVVRAADVAETLKSMDLDVLRRASPKGVRTRALAAAGLTTVWDVRNHQRHHKSLLDLPGLGEGSARAISAAALRLEQGVRDETPVRIDVKKRGQHTQDLLEALRAWDASRRFEPTADELALAQSLVTLLKAKPAPTHVLVMSESQDVDASDVVTLLESALERARPTTDTADTWTDFLSRPADYFGMLTELGFLTEDEKQMHGDLPEDVIEAVRAIELKRDFLTASLRAYQDFGARFVLAQKKVVIGDEMGLGKTVEALAVLTHLRAKGHTHFVVVCPAAVVSNWVREIQRHTTLGSTAIHGPAWERAHAIKRWLYNGGVAVTTVGLARDLLPEIGDTEVACAIFDEAHYIKNPTAKRSVAAAALIDRVPYAVLMTGTPLENRVQEFRNLIGYIRPDLADDAPDYLPSKFRKHVAPAYLRRNQEDVLTELPELIEVEEWMAMTPAVEQEYSAAVSEGHFMKMRRAAMLSTESNKFKRLVDILVEAEANDRKVIVFSYFRDVLDTVADQLPVEVFGPLTGSTPSRERQILVDKFTEAPGGAALVAQITAGGVGLNIQSASVVVICEPQVKPTLEAQAVARAHRMGQTQSVQVHRLLTENSVDERVFEILADKRQLFDEFARDSVIAEQAPDAVDMSEAELARRVIAAERERLLTEPVPGN